MKSDNIFEEFKKTMEIVRKFSRPIKIYNPKPEEWKSNNSKSTGYSKQLY